MTTINITPDFPAVHDQFMREFEYAVQRAVREAVVDEERGTDTLKSLRETLVFLWIAIENIATVEAFAAFRSRLAPVITGLADSHDRLASS